MIITIENLQAGMDWWRQKNWPEDFHNAIYSDIYHCRWGGITPKWWGATVDRLSQWRAYRGQKRPNTKREITARGQERLSRIADQYTKLLASSTGEPTITGLFWDEVSPLFFIASEIKSGSPVFASKLCHFVFPRVFMVMDNLATGVFDYEFYWRGMRDEWDRFNQKNEAKNLLMSSVKAEAPLHPLYPIETKIMELSHIGHNYR